MKKIILLILCAALAGLYVGCGTSEEAADAAKKKMGEAGEKVAEAADKATEHASDMASHAKAAVNKATEAAGHATDAAYETASGEIDAGIACASCVYKMEGVQGCQPAVKVAGKTMLLTGVSVDAHEYGLCSGEKQAALKGGIKDGKFVATDVAMK